MKVYEKLGFDTEDALKWVELCERKKCADCPAKRDDETICTAKCAADYLLSEVPEPPKVPRWQTAKTQEDFDKLFAEFNKYCKLTFQCKNCRLDGTPDKGPCDCYHAYLSELVPEVQE